MSSKSSDFNKLLVAIDQIAVSNDKRFVVSRAKQSLTISTIKVIDLQTQKQIYHFDGGYSCNDSLSIASNIKS